MWIVLGLLLACSAVAEPPESPAPPSPPPPAPGHAMPADLTHLPVTLKLPYHPWDHAYGILRAQPSLAPRVEAMIAAVQAPGDPEERLRALTRATGDTMKAVAALGEPDPRPVQAVNQVDTDLRVAFFHDLSLAIAAAAAPADERRAALLRLRELVVAPAPVGIGAPHPHRTWSTFAQQSAQTDIDVALETVGA